MADQGKTEQEPSIEEILASIRQIISDDDEPANSKEAPNSPAKTADDDFIELVDRVEEEPTVTAAPSVPQPSFREELARVPEPAPVVRQSSVRRPDPEPDPEPEGLEIAMKDISARMNVDPDIDSVFSDQAANAAYGAFSELAARAAIDRSGSVTIEDLVREMMKPMLRAWIDKNVPKIVERLLQQELERISKRAVED